MKLLMGITATNMLITVRNKVPLMVDSVNHLLFHGFGNPFLLIIGYLLNDLIHLIAK